jgi:hypothetical protein
MQELIGAASALAGVVLGAVLPRFFDWLRRPVVKLELDSPEHGDKWSVHAISVTNVGSSLAKNCHGMITLDAHEADLCPDDQVLRLSDLGINRAKFNVKGPETLLLHQGDWRDIRNELLAWSQIGNPLSLDIYPDTHPMLDVFRLMKAKGGKPSQIQFGSERGWASLRGAFLLTKDYRLTIRIGVENGDAAKRAYCIRRKGDDVEVVPDDGARAQAVPR